MIGLFCFALAVLASPFKSMLSEHNNVVKAFPSDRTD
jgi:hypothetical protein